MITDHLGNTRLRFSNLDGNTQIDSTELLSTHDYYPFGLEWQDGGYKYTFNGIERNEALGVNWHETLFRTYDATTGRWGQIDPILKFAESPYAGFGNSPGVFIDPLGTDTLRAIGDDLFGTYQFEPVTVMPASSSSGGAVQNAIFANRFSYWEPMGTGAGLSVNPNFPQYSSFTEGAKNVSWQMLSPVLMGVAGAGVSAEVGGGRELLKAAYRMRNRLDLVRLLRAQPRISRQASESFAYVDELGKSGLLPQRRAPAGGIRINGKRYEEGQFIPGSRVVNYGREVSKIETLPIHPLSNGTRPSPIYYPSLSPLERAIIGGGGGSLILLRHVKKNNR